MTQVILTTLALAGLTSGLLLLLATPLAWLLARHQGWLIDSVTALASLPLVLPPTVLGFYLLVALGPQGPLAPLLHEFGITTLAFSFKGLVIGSMIYSLPFALQPIRTAFAAIPPRLFEAAASLRAGPLDRFFTVALPLARSGLVTGFILAFAHTIGEFGVVLMIGGDIPGQTRVLSTAIYDAVENNDTMTANQISLGMLAFSFVVIVLLRRLDRGRA